MSAVLQRMAVLQAVPDAPAQGDESDPEVADMVRLAALMPADETQLLYSICLHGRAELGLAPDEYAALTMVLLRLLAFKPATAQRAPAEKKSLNDAAGAVATPVAPAAREASLPRAVPAPPAAPAPTPIATPRVAQAVPVVQMPAGARPASTAESSQASVPPAPTADRMESLPVRVQADSRLEALAAQSAATVLQPTAEGEFWHATVQQLIAAEAIAAMVRELALQSQLVARDTDQWILRVERESLNQSASRERLGAALQVAGHPVRLMVEIGRVTDSPARRNVALAAERQLAAEKIIFDDPLVQTLMRDFAAKIVPGSIKPG